MKLNRIRHAVRILFATVLLGFAALSFAQPQYTAQAATRYIFATFKGNATAQEKLSIYTSTDGLNFTLFSDTGYSGPTGELRDPSIMKHTDGKYYIAYTTHSFTTASTSFGIANSTDLAHWTFVATVNSGVANTHFTWAPEWFKDTDGSIRLVVSVDDSGNGSNFRTFSYTPTNSSLTAWSGPTYMGIAGNYIDTFIVKVGSTYNAFSKGPTWIEHATATNILGPWTWVGTGNWAGWGSGKEGPAFYQLDNGQWRAFLDCFSGCGFLYTTSSNLTSWTAPVALPGLSGVVRHGTVLRETGVTITTVNDNTTGTGNNQFNYSSGWSYGSQSGAFQNDNHWSGAANNSVTVKFNGTKIALYGARNTNHGIGAVSIDGGAETNVDYYAATRSDNVLMWTSPTLSAGAHTFKLRVTGTKNASSTGTAVTTDRVDITP